MEDFKKIVRLGTQGRLRSTFCKITFKEGKLSITGVEGPLPSGNCMGGCGQIDMSLKPADIKLAPGWTTAMIVEFLAIWKEWHLNDMQAGTPAQMEELKKHKFPGYPLSYYLWAKELLKAAGLDPDNGYAYGTKWLRKEVPEAVLEWLKALPDTDKQPAWV